MKKLPRLHTLWRTDGAPASLKRDFLLLLLVVPALGLSVKAQAPVFSPHYAGPYETVAGKFFIRLYVVYAQNGDPGWTDSLGSAELERRTGQTFAMLNAAFNRHDIFFVPGQTTPGACYSVFRKMNNEPDPDIADGIMLYVRSDHPQEYATGSVIGSSSLPARRFEVLGNEDGTPANNLPVTIQMIGHCLGLAHTFESTTGAGIYTGPAPSCSSGACASGYGSDPDECCGDMVGDTPKHGIDTFIRIAADCQSSESPGSLSPGIFRNYMSYSYPTRCRDHFTEQQARRMRLYLKNASVLAPVLIDPETIASGTPVVWNAPQSKGSNVEIPSGATLTVNDVLEMAPGTYIIVRRGGALIVNGTITAGCGGMWGGIVVEGAANQPQKDSLGQPSMAQGRFVLNASGIVEHAVDGVAAQGFLYPDEPDFGGGILEVYGRIQNCTKGIRIQRYRNPGVPNAGLAQGAFLILNDNYRGGAAEQPILINIRKINRFNISNTWCYDNRAQSCIGRKSRALGLLADDASFSIRSSLFRNLDRGIQIRPLQSGGLGAYEVEDCSFFNCYTGIESNLPDVFRINYNYFEVGRPPMCPADAVNGDYAGVRLLGYTLPEGIELSGNQFVPGNFDDLNESVTGVDCRGTGTRENTIRANTYQSLSIGNRVAGNNGGPTGLRFECNVFDNNLQAFAALPNSSVRGIQGGTDPNLPWITATGNRFSGPGHTWKNEGAPIQYYFLASAANQYLTGGAGFTNVDTVRTTQPNPNCALPGGGCLPPCPPEDVEEWEGAFEQERSAWQTGRGQSQISGYSTERTALRNKALSHRSAMDHWGGLIIRHFALDSTGAKVDSALAWTRRLRAYEADLRLARHAFFTGDLEGYDAWLDSIPARNDLSEIQSDELADFIAVLAIVRPYAEAETDLHHLPATALDSLEVWAENCHEPGFLARTLLLGNGRELMPDCSGAALRPAQTTATTMPAATTQIRLYPNPSTGQFFVELPEKSAPVRVLLHTPDGRPVFDQILTASATLDGTALRPGLYFCRVVDSTGPRLVAKLIISR